MKKENIDQLLIGLVDADLMDGGTRHPNLVLLKIAGFLKDNNITFELITNTNEEVSRFTRIYISKVFTFTANPHFYDQAIGTDNEKKYAVGGTGFYMMENNVAIFNKLREKDLNQLEKDKFLNQFPNIRGNRKKMA